MNNEINQEENVKTNVLKYYKNDDNNDENDDDNTPFFLIEKKHSMNFLCKDSFIKKESELENTPFLDSESKIINKKLISDRKNKIFYEKIGNLDNSFFKLSNSPRGISFNFVIDLPYF